MYIIPRNALSLVSCSPEVLASARMILSKTSYHQLDTRELTQLCLCQAESIGVVGRLLHVVSIESFDLEGRAGTCRSFVTKFGATNPWPECRVIDGTWRVKTTFNLCQISAFEIEVGWKFDDNAETFVRVRGDIANVFDVNILEPTIDRMLLVLLFRGRGLDVGFQARC